MMNQIKCEKITDSEGIVSFKGIISPKDTHVVRCRSFFDGSFGSSCSPKIVIKVLDGKKERYVPKIQLERTFSEGLNSNKSK